MIFSCGASGRMLIGGLMRPCSTAIGPSAQRAGLSRSRLLPNGGRVKNCKQLRTGKPEFVGLKAITRLQSTTMAIEVVLATLTEGGLSMSVSLPLLSADFDGSGTVDDIDLGYLVD